MTHVRLWRFEVAPEREAGFLAAYRADGHWARLFATAPGFIRTELWRDGDGVYLTADHWLSVQAFEAFQAGHGDAYRQLDAELEGVAGNESFLGAFDLVE
jgi:heme-degrading monooxygenase HmoA